MFYEEKTEPRLSDYTGKGNLSYEALLDILETVSTRHSLSIGDRLTNGSVAWMILDWRVEILRRPRLLENFTVKTWSKGKLNSYTSGREFSVCSAKGEHLVRVASKYALVDVKEKKMVKVGDELEGMYRPEEETQFAEDAPKLTVPETFDLEAPLVLRKSDLDYNGHVHNTKYLVYALEALPADDYRADDFTSIRIVYRSSLKYGDDAVIKRKSIEGGYSFCIFAGETLCTIIELKK